MRAAADVVDEATLDMHAADEHRIGPQEVGVRCLSDILVDKTNVPMRREVGRDHEQALRRHERLGVVSKMVGVFERAKGRLVMRKHAQDAPHTNFIHMSHEI